MLLLNNFDEFVDKVWVFGGFDANGDFVLFPGRKKAICYLAIVFFAFEVLKVSHKQLDVRRPIPKF